jgi:hypothetical protein
MVFGPDEGEQFVYFAREADPLRLSVLRAASDELHTSASLLVDDWLGKGDRAWVAGRCRRALGP